MDMYHLSATIGAQLGSVAPRVYQMISLEFSLLRLICWGVSLPR